MAPNETQAAWRSALKAAARSLGLEMRSVGTLAGRVDGYSVGVFAQRNDQGGFNTGFAVSLPGWPTTSHLRLMPRRRRLNFWPFFRGHYIAFGDAEWDQAFAVTALEPDIVRRELNWERRAAFKACSDQVRWHQLAIGRGYSPMVTEWTPVLRKPLPYSIRGGYLLSGFDGGLVTNPDVIVKLVQEMIGLASAMTEPGTDPRLAQ